MSGKPTIEGANEVLGMIERLTALHAERAELRKHEERARIVDECLVDLSAQLRERLRSMDLTQGNSGFENRLAWFLGAFRSATIASVQP